MKILSLLTVCLLGSCSQPSTSAQGPVAPSSQSTPQAPRGTTGAATPTSVAVVELFTSQGCSSCPAADNVLRHIAETSHKNQRPVYCLSFHVDYWNSLGWPDPYSSEQATSRQRGYAAAMSNPQVYTPQMIVNGHDEFVGSRSTEAERAIDTALNTPALCRVELRAVLLPGGRQAVINYVVSGQSTESVLNAAVVQSRAQNEVPRGENSGRTLGHVNVVQAFQTVLLSDATQGELQLTLPADFDAKRSSVIAYVQQRSTWHIIGATETRLTNEPAAHR